MDMAWSGITTHGDDIDFEGVHMIDPYMLPNDVTARLIQSESAICIWKYNKHPHELVPYHFTFDGDEGSAHAQEQIYSLAAARGQVWRM